MVGLARGSTPPYILSNFDSIEGDLTPRRKFTVADGMVLVAASAVGLGLLRVHQAAYDDLLQYQSPYRVYPGWMTRLPDRKQVAGVVPILLAWSLSVLALQLRRPRPHLRRLIHLPGFAVCLSAAVAVSLWLAGHVR